MECARDGVGDPADSRAFGDRLRTIRALQDQDDRARAAAMSISERLALGVELSMFSARMRAAFREQSRGTR